STILDADGTERERQREFVQGGCQRIVHGAVRPDGKRGHPNAAHVPYQEPIPDLDTPRRSVARLSTENQWDLGRNTSFGCSQKGAPGEFLAPYVFVPCTRQILHRAKVRAVHYRRTSAGIPTAVQT